jgi:triosephosphate isomerase
MNKKIIIANWKSNLTNKQSMDLTYKIVCLDTLHTHFVIIPSFTSIYSIMKILKDKHSTIEYGSQDISHNMCTGDISIDMLKDLDCKYIIIGHSERRSLYTTTNTNNEIQKKLKLILENNIIPILCIGEDIDIRNSGNYINYIIHMLKECIYDIKKDDIQKIIIAYEPIWAIGNDKTANIYNIEEIIIAIREYISIIYNQDISKHIKIIYGGSVNSSNIKNISFIEKHLLNLTYQIFIVFILFSKKMTCRWNFFQWVDIL